MNKPTGEQIVFGILSYMHILVLIPLLVKKDDDFVHFHSKQGLILLVCWLFAAILGYFVSFIGFFWWVSSILILVLSIVSLVAIIKVLMGEKWEIPVVSTYADKLNI